ncbi:hypothetical protein BGZ58_000179, partial [Dissophora ornata]
MFQAWKSKWSGDPKEPRNTNSTTSNNNNNNNNSNGDRSNQLDNSPGYFQQRPHHQPNVFDDMLDTDEVEEGDADITRAEEQEVHNQKRAQAMISPGFSTSGMSTGATWSDPPSYEQGMGGKLRLHARVMRAKEGGAK